MTIAERKIVVDLTAVLPVDAQADIVRVAEALARAAIGLALEGISLSLNYGIVDPDEGDVA